MRTRWFLLGSATTLAAVALAFWRWLLKPTADYEWTESRARPHDEASRIG